MSESRVRTYETNYSNNFIAWNFLKIRKSLSLYPFTYKYINILFVSFLTIYTNTSHIFSKNNYRRIQNFSSLWKTFISISIFPPKLFRLFPKYSGWHLIIYEIIQPRAKIHNFFFSDSQKSQKLSLEKIYPSWQPLSLQFSRQAYYSYNVPQRTPKKKKLETQPGASPDGCYTGIRSVWQSRNDNWDDTWGTRLIAKRGTRRSRGWIGWWDTGRVDRRSAAFCACF